MTVETTTSPKKNPPSTRWYARCARWCASTWIGRKATSAWRRSGNTKPIKWRHLFGGILVLGALGMIVVALIQAVADTNVRQDRDTAAEQVYQAALIDYQRNVAEHAFCLDAASARVDSRNALRAQLISIALNGAQRSIEQAEGLRTAVLTILPDSAAARTAMDNYVQLATEAADRSITRAHDSQDAEYAMLDVVTEQAKCPPLGPVPVRPNQA